jgi:hypothetical protein
MDVPMTAGKSWVVTRAGVPLGADRTTVAVLAIVSLADLVLPWHRQSVFGVAIDLAILYRALALGRGWMATL